MLISAGIDIGSRSIGFAMLNAEQGTLLHQEIIDSGYDPIGRARDHVAQFEFDRLVATGYGRHAAQAKFADEVITEIRAYARGARFLHPQIRTILDIGGQDTKAILLDDIGAVLEFQMNEKCAAGTGKFLEVMAVALGYTLEEFVNAPFAAQGESIRVSSMCTVFAESEAVSLLHKGVDRCAVARSLHESIAERVIGMLKRVGAETPLMFAGGGAKNRFLCHILQERTGWEFIIPEEPQTVGAIGAAREAARQLLK